MNSGKSQQRNGGKSQGQRTDEYGGAGDQEEREEINQAAMVDIG